MAKVTWGQPGKSGGQAFVDALLKSYRRAEERGIEGRKETRVEEEAKSTRKYREETLKQGALKQAYDVAGDRMSTYLETVDDPSSDEAIAAAETLYAQAFDNSMRTFGFPDITYADVTPEPKEEIEEEEEKPKFPGLFPQARAAVGGLPTETPTPQKVGTALRAGVGETIGQIPKLPSQIAGLGATGYNVLAQGLTGATGVPQQTIPQPYLDVMRQGKLFEKPFENLKTSGAAFGEGFKYAGDYYKKTIQRMMKGQ